MLPRKSAGRASCPDQLSGGSTPFEVGLQVRPTQRVVSTAVIGSNGRDHVHEQVSCPAIGAKGIKIVRVKGNYLSFLFTSHRALI